MTSFNNALMVAAIDFGTTFSGYAFSLRSDYLSDPLKISANQWKSPTMISHKTPTTVLMNAQQELVSFGYEAETKYSQLADQGTHGEYYYFKRFKMILYAELRKSRLTKSITIPDINNKHLPAITVFAKAIDYLRRHMLQHLDSRGMAVIKADEIHWVLTVPAIWDDPAKQFMREAAQQANIKGDHLTIALEPEAASIFCKHLSLERKGDDFNVFQAGRRYLMLDAGGGTIDITVHEIQRDGRIRELERASGGAWGGIFVDEAFNKLLAEVLGEEVYDRYRTEHTSDFIEISREFELKKRSLEDKNVNSCDARTITMKIPVSFKKMCKEMHNKSIEERTKEIKFSDITWCRDKLRINKDRFADLFKPVCEGIVTHIQNLLKRPATKGTDTFLMVGGFSESIFLQNTIREAFSYIHVIVPNDAGLAVLKGAVLYGHKPNAIAVRVAKYTYGVGVYKEFDKSKHPVSKKEIIKGITYCKDVFSIHIEKGDVLEISEAQIEQPYKPLEPSQTKLTFNVFTSTEKEPKFTDDNGCRCLGSLSVDVSDAGTNKNVLVKFIFGGTEIKVVGKNAYTNKETEVKFNFLDEDICLEENEEASLS